MYLTSRHGSQSECRSCPTRQHSFTNFRTHFLNKTISYSESSKISRLSVKPDATPRKRRLKERLRSVCFKPGDSYCFKRTHCQRRYRRSENGPWTRGLFKQRHISSLNWDFGGKSRAKVCSSKGNCDIYYSLDRVWVPSLPWLPSELRIRSDWFGLHMDHQVPANKSTPSEQLIRNSYESHNYANAFAVSRVLSWCRWVVRWVLLLHKALTIWGIAWDRVCRWFSRRHEQRNLGPYQEPTKMFQRRF